VRALALDSGSGELISADIEGEYIVWNLTSTAQIRRHQRPAGSTVAFAVIPGTGLILSGVNEIRAGHANATAAQRSIHPFEEEAIRTILSSSGGNLRAFIQMCAESFERALPTRRAIGPDLVRKVLELRGQEPLDPEAVARRIEKMVAERGLAFRRNYEVRGATARLAVLGTDGVPRMLVTVSKPLFHTDEAQSALDNIDLISRARGLPAEVVMVVAGYASPEVLTQLARAGNEVLVYRPDRFDAEIGALLDRLRSDLSRQPEAAPEWSELKRELESVKATLTQIASVRGKESTNLENSLRDILRQQNEGRSDRQIDEARVAWAHERKLLEDRIREARKRQRELDLTELESLRAKAEQRFHALMRNGAFAVGAGAVAGLVFGVTQYGDYSNRYLLQQGILYAAGGAALVVSYVLAPLFLIRNKAVVGPLLRMRDLAARVSSLEELERLAAKYVDSNQREGHVLRLLAHEHPHLRWAGALNWTKLKSASSVDAMTLAINREPSRALRTRLVHQLAKIDSTQVKAVIGGVDAKRTPELGYLVEAAARDARLSEDAARDISPAMGLLARIAALKQADGQGFTAADLFEPTRSLPASSRGAPRMNERRINETLRDLSPLQPPGLGTLDELECIDQIDALFFELSQIRFYQERGLAEAMEPPALRGAKQTLQL
jgi:hypothetical protein